MMTAKDKEKYVFNVFQNIADSYDSANYRISIGAHMHWKKSAARSLLNTLPSGCRLLDVGCGTGDMLRIFNKEDPQAKLTGLDFSPNMLRIAKADCSGIKDIELVQGNAQKLPFTAECFDGVSIAFALRNTADYTKTLKEAARVLRPGGCITVIDSFVPGNRFIRPFYTFYFSVIMPILGGGHGKIKEYRWLTRSTKEFITPEELKALFEKAGFKCLGRKTFLFGACSYITGQKL